MLQVYRTYIVIIIFEDKKKVEILLQQVETHTHVERRNAAFADGSKSSLSFYFQLFLDFLCLTTTFHLVHWLLLINKDVRLEKKIYKGT